VFGGIAGDAIARWVPRHGEWAEPDSAALDAARGAALAPFARPAASLSPLRDRLADLMWDKAGILRDAQRLAQAEAGLAALTAEHAVTGVADGARGFNLAWADWLNLDSLLLTSRVIVLAAQAREESRGAHWREDFPHTVDAAQGLSVTRVTLRDGAPVLDWQKVNYTRLQPGQSLLAAE
jgi:fumarate reductase flavoprotein subunit